MDFFFPFLVIFVFLAIINEEIYQTSLYIFLYIFHLNKNSITTHVSVVFKPTTIIFGADL